MLKCLVKWFFGGLLALIFVVFIWSGVMRQLAFSELCQLVDRADELVVHEGPLFDDGKTLFTSRTLKDRTELKKAMAVAFWSIDDECTCFGRGTPVIFLYRESKELTAITNLHFKSIRWSTWQTDARLRNPEKWFEWFEVRGIIELSKEYNKKRGL